MRSVGRGERRRVGGEGVNKMEFFREEKHPFGIWGGIDIVGYIGRMVAGRGARCDVSARGVDGGRNLGEGILIKWSFFVRKNILLGYGEELILVGVGRLVVWIGCGGVWVWGAGVGVRGSAGGVGGRWNLGRGDFNKMEFFREEKHPFGIWGGIDIGRCWEVGCLDWVRRGCEIWGGWCEM